MINFIIIIAFYWDDKAKRRKWFDNFAKINNIDPLIPKNWYSITTSDISSVKVTLLPLSFFKFIILIIIMKAGDAVLKIYSGSLVKALIDAYPDIGLEEIKFRAVPSITFYYN